MNDGRRRISIYSESGSMIVPIIVLGLVFCIVGAAAVSFVSRQGKAQARLRVASELENLNTRIVMLYSNEKYCQSQLTPSGLGTSLTSLSSQVRLSFPAPANQVLQAGTSYNQVELQRIYFLAPTQIHTVQPIYFSYLVIESKDSIQPGSDQRTSIPFYFFTDNKGLFSCFATAFVPASGPLPSMTSEDLICRQFGISLTGAANAKNYIYSPISKTCLEEP